MYKRAVPTALAVLVLGLSAGLTGCQALPLEETECNAVVAKLNKTYVDPATVTWATADSGSIMNIGDTNRASMKAAITKAYPFMPELVAEFQAANAPEETYPEMIEAAAEAYLLQELTSNASESKVTFTDSEWDSLLKDDETALADKDAFITSTCEDIAQKLKELPTDPPRDSPYTYYGAVLEQVTRGAVAYQSIFSCENPKLYLPRVWKCSSEEWIPSEDSGADSDDTSGMRNPFLDPVTDESIQNMAEIAWCTRLGKIVNANRTGCVAA
jgi:hypothetical protein